MKNIVSLVIACLIISSCGESKLPENKFIKEDKTIQYFEWTNCDIQACASSRFNNFNDAFLPQISFKVISVPLKWDELNN